MRLLKSWLRRIKYFVRILPIIVIALPSVARSSSAPVEFGFTGPEIFPIDNLISFLRVSDLNGDGLNDLIVVNNLRSKINFLINRSGNEPDTVELLYSGTFTKNRLPPDARFRIESVSSEKRITSLVVDDLNSDGLPDIAYYGNPPELITQFNRGDDGWSAPVRHPIRDGLPNPNGLTTGDLNGDQRRDLILMAEGHMYLFIQSNEGELGEPMRVPYTGEVKSVQALDINGDQLDDLLLVNWENAFPFRVRLQMAGGDLGPEYHFEFLPIRSYWADDLDGDRRTEVMTIAQTSGKAQVSNFIQKPATPLSGSLKEGQFNVLPLNRSSKAGRGIAWGDVNGDEIPDLLVSEPANGQVSVYMQSESGVLENPRSFPSFAGISEIEIVDFDGDSKPEIFLLSSDERLIGVSRFSESGRLSFPEPMGFLGRPLAIASGAIEFDSNEAVNALVAIVNEEGTRKVVVSSGDNQYIQELSDEFRTNPSSVKLHDVNQDGFVDIVILIPYEKTKLLINKSGDGFWESDLTPPGGTSDQPWMSAADIDGDGSDELLLAKDNFIRALVLRNENSDPSATPQWRFTVKEQINGSSSSSKIIGATVLQDSDGKDSIFLLDGQRRSLTLCQKDSVGVWQPIKNVDLPFVGNRIESLQLGKGGINAISMISPNSVAWMNFEGMVWDLAELDSYETPIERGHLLDVISGDLNQDQRKDLVFLEIARHYVDIVKFEEGNVLKPANRWQVFETKTFRPRQGVIPEPREALVSDLTGDGKNDLVLLVHDRILVYPQE